MTLKRRVKRNRYKLLGIFLGILLMVSFAPNTAYATGTTTEGLTEGTGGSNPDTLSPSNTVGGLSINYNTDGEGGLSASIKILLFLTIISLAPSILIMLTSFTRIIIVLHFTRAALATQTAPPNQVLVGLALFLTLFIMGPIFTQINDTAIKPLDAGEITQEQALEIGLEPLREFMFEQTQTRDIQLFLDIAQVNTTIESQNDVPITVLIPSFIISELRSAFIMGFLIYIPFIIIDMVVASTLMSMGMMMLPPTTISMPFKLLLFILADGWNLIIGNLVKTFY
ncbi:flagellar type III secretion system pore protein FliP [Konateibacter massiliensis]|uniref:flagellar type III secretion system pore protein FliP n=1 Tax=Konateibacter massiliensis TaxID=2002841 RepID=UPI000C15A178|nr:flagellar type III secretion system pore protein FliP [Konateibacter massiliensis]